MAQVVCTLLFQINPEDIPCKPIRMDDSEFVLLANKYGDYISSWHSKRGYVSRMLGSLAKKLNLSGISYISERYALLDKAKCLCAIRDIDFLLQYFHNNPEFVYSFFEDWFSYVGILPEEILSILNLSDSELFELAKNHEDGDTFYDCLDYLRDQRKILDYMQKVDGTALHMVSD